MGLRVADLERSLAFYAALGYEVIGSVRATSLGDLTMLKLPDDPFVAIEPDGNRIELVPWPTDHPDGMTAADFSDA